jgi:hypothetical protein
MESQVDDCGYSKDGRRWVVMSGVLLLVGAWLLWGVGRQAVARLDWSGYDRDPDIAQSLANDRRCARVYLPFGVWALVADACGCIAAVAAWVQSEKQTLAVGFVLACVGSLCWHGLACAVAFFFALGAG